MTSMHDQMRTDSIWIKPNPASNITLATRTHGQHYLYNYAPNFKERLEMSMRSLGRQYDWDMEKFRNDKKPADRGNKRRIFKNIFRFFKNPLGHTAWKMKGILVGGRVMVTFFIIMFPLGFARGYIDSAANSKETAFYVKLGDTINGNRDSFIGHNDSIRPFPWNFANNAGYVKLSAKNYVVNPTYKMNYKKHNETLNRNKEAIFKYFDATTMKQAHSRNFGFN